MSALSETIDGIVVSCLLIKTSEDIRRPVLVLSSDGKTRVIAEERSQSDFHARDPPSTDSDSESNHVSHYSYKNNNDSHPL